MNRLQFETSPYLHQHADNPVDWYPWGSEALAAAVAQDKPILLSIGYSACHWCHVMAHESFEDPDTAAFMNANFISIKVDREERPDLDDIYMQATLTFTQGHGGWPMTVFLTPAGQPFHAGTYFPKDDRYGVPSFRRIMEAVLQAYRERRDQVEQLGAQVAESLSRTELATGRDPDLTLLDTAIARLLQDYDPVNGGLSRGAPKFPNPTNLEFALQQAINGTGDLAARAKEAVTQSLKRIANGGIHDQIGGGFHRYSVDDRWLVPHFEKMLYDNAQLGRVYLHTWQATGDRFFMNVAITTCDYLLREMRAPEGGFYSATDADSEGIEGRFFVWTLDELRDALPADQYEAVVTYYGATDPGNFEGANILYVSDLDRPETFAAAELGITVGDLNTRLAIARATLYEIRAKRVPPATDDKRLAAWNGLVLTSLAEAARALDNAEYRAAAIDLATCLWNHFVKDGRVFRTYKDGIAKLTGYLEDYAALIEGFLATYQLTFDPAWFTAARTLVDQAIAHFSAANGGFFDTADDAEALIARPRIVQDNAIPAGGNKFARVLLLMAAYTGDAGYESAARGILRPLIDAMREYPGAFGEALIASDLLIRGIQAVALIGDPAQAATQSLITVLGQVEGQPIYRPNVILALSPAATGDHATPPLLAQRKSINDQPSAYVCREFVCLRPVSDAAALLEQLDQRRDG